MSFGRFKDDNGSSKTQTGGSSSESSRDSSSGTSASSTSNGNRKEAYIGKGSKIVGNLEFSGPTELDGQVDGEIIAQDRLTIGESAVINAKISGTEVVVKGSVNGDIFGSKRIVLKKPARVVGSLTTALLSIDEGVIVDGKISMVAAEKKSQEANLSDNKTVSDSNLSKQGDPKLGESKPGLSALR